MYKCVECGNIFDDGEQRTVREDYGETISVCPVCGGAYEEAYNCIKCGDVFLINELNEHICSDCLRDAVTYDTALEYLNAKNELVMFMVGCFYESDWTPHKPSEAFRAAMEENYRRMKCNDLLTDKETFLNCIRSFILEDECSKGEFAKWLKGNWKND